MSTNLPDVISRYFERDADRDIDSILSLFAENATVIDEGEERHGTAEIRTWQTGPASKYTYTTEITGTESLGPNRYLVTGRLTGAASTASNVAILAQLDQLGIDGEANCLADFLGDSEIQQVVAQMRAHQEFGGQIRYGARAMAGIGLGGADPAV